MARPRIFISSTYYDLKYIRASLELFVESLGFDVILSEKGDIAFAPDLALDESCYREIASADILVLIIGGRYGSPASSSTKGTDKLFFDRYDSITKKEYETAIERDIPMIPMYVLIERGVYAEHQTFARNRGTTAVNYAHVDSVNVFHLIDGILSKSRNNPVHTFDKSIDIESWLREQWAGLFREMLNRKSQAQQLLGLSVQVAQLKETNETLKRYIEALMRDDDKQDKSNLVKKEKVRLEQLPELLRNPWVEYSSQRSGIDVGTIVSIIRDSRSFPDFLARVKAVSRNPGAHTVLRETARDTPAALRDLNEVRVALGLPIFKIRHSRSDELDIKSAKPKGRQVTPDEGPKRLLLGS